MCKGISYRVRRAWAHNLFNRTVLRMRPKPRYLVLRYSINPIQQGVLHPQTGTIKKGSGTKPLIEFCPEKYFTVSFLSLRVLGAPRRLSSKRGERQPGPTYPVCSTSVQHAFVRRSGRDYSEHWAHNLFKSELSVTNLTKQGRFHMTNRY